MSPVPSPLDHVRSYYQALDTGDAAAVAAHFTPDATHYSGGLRPPTPSLRLDYPRMGRPHDRTRAIAGVVIEWTMAWAEPGSGE